MTGSATYAAGPGGQGRTIAIVDAGFDRLTEAQAAGAAPAVTAFSYDGELEEGTKHGTACLETASSWLCCASRSWARAAW